MKFPTLTNEAEYTIAAALQVTHTYPELAISRDITDSEYTTFTHAA